MVAAKVQYHWGHGLGSVFKVLLCTAIPLLKGHILQAGMHLVSKMLSGKTMKQALKNWVTHLVEDLMQGTSTEAAPDQKHPSPTKWCKCPFNHMGQDKASRGSKYLWHRGILAW